MEWIQAFTKVVAEEVVRSGGVVDDFYGDGVKADFGVPLPRTSPASIARDARNALDCALAIAARFRELPGPATDPSPKGLRVGISSGMAVAGSVGSTERLKYTVVGDVINVASRLESFDVVAHDFDREPSRILASQETLALVGDEFVTEFLGRHALKGKEYSVEVHRVLRRRVSPATGEQTDRSRT